MLEFPISYFLIPYAFFAFVFVIFSFFNIYHMLRYGIYNFSLYILSVVYLGGTVFFLGASIIIILSFNWSVPLNLDAIIGTSQTELLLPL